MAETTVSVEQEQLEDIAYGLAASPNFAQDGLCFAARRSGLYRSEDGGRTWQSAYDSLNLEESLATMAVALSPNFGTDQNVFAGVPGGVLRSIDGGQSWEVVTLASPPPIVSTLIVSPNFVEDGVLLAGTLEDGVFRSADRGRHWASWNFGLLDLNTLVLASSPNFAKDETLFVGADSGIFRSTNGGRAWREVNLPMGYEPVLSLAVSPNFAEEGTLFAGTETQGLWHSADQGQSWTRLGEETITAAVNAVLLSPEYPTRPDILILHNDALLISRDGGQSWTQWPATPSVERNIISVAAPQGLDPEAPLLVGRINGDVERI